jgi:DNA-directed RNA polymerase subunit L
VTFAAYRVPHPLKPEVILRISTEEPHQSRGRFAPDSRTQFARDAFKDALGSLIADFDALLQSLSSRHETPTPGGGGKASPEPIPVPTLSTCWADLADDDLSEYSFLED